MIAKILIAVSAAVVLVLGVIHLTYTFWGTKLTPRDPSVLEAMNSASPVITDEMTVWRGWIGFNATYAGDLNETGGGGERARF